MTFKYKLSVRLALLKDALLLVSVTALACEKPAGVTGPGSGPSGPVVSRVALAPPQITLHPNQTSQFTAVGLTAAGDTIAVAVTWSATGGSIVDTSSKGSIHYATYQPSTAPGTYLVIATDPPETGVADTSSVIVIPVPVASVSLSPAVATVLLGATLQLTATPQDSSSAALSGRVVTWASSAPAVATVSATGLLTPVPVTSVVVSPATASVPAGATLQLGASAKDSSGGALTGRVVTWSTSAASVATVNASGLVKGVAPGSATITASAEGKAGTSTITVTQVPVASVTVSPASASVSVGGSVPLTATPKDASGSALTGRVVTWSSSASTVASVTSSGLVTGVAAGSATITASSEGKSATSAITVSAVTGTHAGHYVAPGGSAGGDGTATKPWDLATALAQPASVVPGDTIWLRGGVYAGIFTSRLAGTPSVVLGL